MSPAEQAIPTIPFPAQPSRTPLDHAIHTCGRRLLAFRTEVVTALPDKGDAQTRVRELLDLSRIVDEMFLAFGQECRSEFGHLIDLAEFADASRRSLEGNATHVICAAMEATYPYDQAAE